jgi:FkbM family methyltransferase
MFIKLKHFLRNAIPLKLQVPCKYFYEYGSFRLEFEISLLRYLVSGRGHAIDIGGNRGLYTYCLSRLGADIDVFEPNRVCHRLLKAWIDARKNIRLHEAALSDRAGWSTLYIPVDEFGVEHDSSGALQHMHPSVARPQRVKLETLDSYNFSKVDLIKIDVEGHEYSVLIGAQNTIKNSKPALIIEIESRHNSSPIDETFDLITSFGYCGFFFSDRKMKEIADFNITVHQDINNIDANRDKYINNFLFLHQSKIDLGCYNDLFSRYLRL